jgi:hypothetical protein
VRGVLALRLGGEERALLEQAAKDRGVSLGAFVREAALAAARAGLEVFENDPAPDPVPTSEETPARPFLLRRVLPERKDDAGRRPWRGVGGVEPSEGHRFSNIEPGQPLSSWSGSPVTECSRPPIPPPSDSAPHTT